MLPRYITLHHQDLIILLQAIIHPEFTRHLLTTHLGLGTQRRLTILQGLITLHPKVVIPPPAIQHPVITPPLLVQTITPHLITLLPPTPHLPITLHHQAQIMHLQLTEPLLLIPHLSTILRILEEITLPRYITLHHQAQITLRPTIPPL